MLAAEYRRQLNIQPDVVDLRDRYYTPVLSALAPQIVPSGDELNVRNQQDEASCTGFALASVIDSQRVKNGFSANVSVRMLYEMARLHDDLPNNEARGSTLRGALKGFYHNGVCMEEDAPYEYQLNPSWELDFLTAEKARSVSLGAYYRLNHEINDYHAALNEVGAIVVSAKIHVGWKNPKNGEIDFSTRDVGRHAFAIVGYTAEGFLIQNSWGKTWGCYKANGEQLDGVALWKYEDWYENVEDAWVLRLSVAAPKAFDIKIARNHRLIRSSSTQRVLQSPRRLDIHGHFLHLDDGKFVDSGRYAQTSTSVDSIIETLQSQPKYRHLLFFTHGALNTPKEMALRIKAWRETFKKNGIYPVHIMWETGFNNDLVDVVKDLLFKTKERMGSNSRHISDRLEELARPLGHKLWRDLKTTAQLTCSEKTEGGKGIKEIICMARDRPTDLSLHFASTSAGVFVLSELLHLVNVNRSYVQSASIFAPACSLTYYEQKLRPHVGTNLELLNQYSLIDQREIKDSLSVYSKSLLYLVSNALEDVPSVPLLGMEKGIQTLIKKGLPPAHKVYFAGRDRSICDAKSHREFDKDAKTMNHMLNTILGNRVDLKKRFQPSALSEY